VTLPDYHKLTRGDVKCNLKETMLTLTSEVDLEKVKDYWVHIYLLASQEAPVDIWKESELKKLRTAVIRIMLIHPIHQQLSERMVQTAALTAQTNVEEDRRTNRAIGRTTIVLPSNQAALIERN
jgi:hypothetical protein